MKNIGSYGPERTRRTRVVALIVAAVLVVMLLSQLYGYEDFAIILGAVMPFNDAALLHVTAGAIVLVELLSLPYLLAMYLSRLMRIVCGIFATAISLFWLFCSLTNSHASNSALYSTTFELPGGILATVWALLLFAGIVIVIKADTASGNVHLEKKAKLE